MSGTAGGAFWAQVKRYRELGLDPLKWIAGCSVEVERADIVYPSVALARPRLAALDSTVQLADGADLFEAPADGVETLRVVVRPDVSPGSPRAAARANPARACLMMRVPQRATETPDDFANAVTGAVAGVPAAGESDLSTDAPIIVTRLHAVTNPDPLASFAAFEFYAPKPGRGVGYVAVGCESLQAADATLDPFDDRHIASVLSGALAGPCALGACEDLRVIPAFDARGKKTQDLLAAGFAEVGRRYGAHIVEREALGVGKLFIGATALASTRREPPSRHHYVKRGMQVTLTRPLGDLAPLATYLSALSDPEYARRATAAGLDLGVLDAGRERSIEALTTPALRAGAVIRDFSPPFHEVPDLQQHVVATADLGAGGLVALADVARRFEVALRVDQIPLLNEPLSRFATEARWMENSTACAPGAIAVVAYPSVLDEMERAFEAAGLRPTRIATVEARGAAAVKVEQAAGGLIASSSQRARLSFPQSA